MGFPGGGRRRRARALQQSGVLPRWARGARAGAAGLPARRARVRRRCNRVRMKLGRVCLGIGRSGGGLCIRRVCGAEVVPAGGATGTPCPPPWRAMGYMPRAAAPSRRPQGGRSQARVGVARRVWGVWAGWEAPASMRAAPTSAPIPAGCGAPAAARAGRIAQVGWANEAQARLVCVGVQGGNSQSRHRHAVRLEGRARVTRGRHVGSAAGARRGSALSMRARCWRQQGSPKALCGACHRPWPGNMTARRWRRRRWASQQPQARWPRTRRACGRSGWALARRAVRRQRRGGQAPAPRRTAAAAARAFQPAARRRAACCGRRQSRRRARRSRPHRPSSRRGRRRRRHQAAGAPRLRSARPGLPHRRRPARRRRRRCRRRRRRRWRRSARAPRRRCRPRARAPSRPRPPRPPPR